MKKIIVLFFALFLLENNIYAEREISPELQQKIDVVESLYENVSDEANITCVPKIKEDIEIIKNNEDITNKEIQKILEENVDCITQVKDLRINTIKNKISSLEKVVTLFQKKISPFGKFLERFGMFRRKVQELF